MVKALPSITLLFILVISACGPKRPQGGDASVFAIDSTSHHQLEAFFSEPQIARVQSYLQHFKDIKTAHDLHLVYQSVDSINNKLGDSLSTKTGRNLDSVIDFKPLNAIITGIHFEHYEGDAVLIDPELAVFKKIAQTTPEKSDDDFIAIMIYTYGNEKYFVFPRWIQQTTDYSGISLLGDESELNILTQIQTALTADKEFEPELRRVKEMVLYGICSGRCYKNDTPEIMAEMDKIIATINLTAEEKDKLLKRMVEFNKPPIGLYIGCAKKSCACGE